MNFASGYTASSGSTGSSVPRFLSQYRFLPRRARYGPMIRSAVCRIPFTAADGIPDVRVIPPVGHGRPSIADHKMMSRPKISGSFVSGGQARSGCASSNSRSSVDPDRPAHRTNTGSAEAPAYASQPGSSSGPSPAASAMTRQLPVAPEPADKPPPPVKMPPVEPVVPVVAPIDATIPVVLPIDDVGIVGTVIVGGGIGGGVLIGGGRWAS